MSEPTSLAFWNIAPPIGSFTPQQSVDEKLARAIRLGSLVNACGWCYCQSWLTGWADGIAAGTAAARLIIELVPTDRQGRPHDTWRFDWAIKNFNKGCRNRTLDEDNQFRRSWEGRYQYTGSFLDGCPRADEMHRDLNNWKDNCLQQYRWMFDDIPVLCQAGLDERELTAYRLGEILDQGVRPPGVHRSVCLVSEPTAPTLFRPDSFSVLPGQLAPERDWLSLVAGRWAEMFGETEGIKHVQKAARDYLVAAGGRRDLVKDLLCQAAKHIQAIVAAVHTPTTTVFVPSEQEQAQHDRADMLLEPKDETCERAPEFPLHFNEDALTVTNADGVKADFSSERLAFQIVQLLAGKRDPEPDSEGLYSWQKIFADIWKEYDQDGAYERVKTQVSNARRKLNEIGWGIKNIRSSGYRLKKLDREQ